MPSGRKPHKGLLASALCLPESSIPLEAAQAIHEVLSNSAEIRGVRWHFQKDFDADREEDGSQRP
jgi:hypothetical protein